MALAVAFVALASVLKPLVFGAREAAGARRAAAPSKCIRCALVVMIAWGGLCAIVTNFVGGARLRSVAGLRGEEAFPARAGALMLRGGPRR